MISTRNVALTPPHRLIRVRGIARARMRGRMQAENTSTISVIGE